MVASGPTGEPAIAITATPEARDVLRHMSEQHGAIILHVAGPNSGLRMPLCLPAGELRLGARDRLLGVVEGVAIYQMQSRPDGECHCGDYVVDMVDGLPIGFSLDPGNRRRFTIYQKPIPRDHTDSAAPETTDSHGNGDMNDTR
jgi:uncharacterized protein